MSDIVNIRRRASSLEASPQFDSYSKVIIHVSDESTVTVGDDTGRTLEIDNPFGTQQMAADILARLRGYQYQPYEADGALLDPAAEIGDGVAIGNVYGGIYRRGTSFSRLMASSISAPKDEEINHEFKFESPTERKFTREIGDVRATLIVQSDQISAKVSQRQDSQSFGWELLSDHWSVKSNGREVFRVDDSGGTFAGEVVAQSGRIGGFTISASAIYNNISQFGGSQSSGVYIGTNGIQLGQGFKVDASGHMECSNATVRGTIRAGDIQYGGSNGYFNGGGISGGSIGTGQLSNYVVGGVGGGVGYNKATNSGSGSYPGYFQASTIVVPHRLSASSQFYFQSTPVGWVTKTITPGTTYTIKYLGSY